jgi:hypothetical protein
MAPDISKTVEQFLDIHRRGKVRMLEADEAARWSALKAALIDQFGRPVADPAGSHGLHPCPCCADPAHRCPKP